MALTPIVTIPKSLTGQEELVVLSKREFERLTKGHAHAVPSFVRYETKLWKGKKYKVPVYQLRGKAAENLDREVRQAMREYREGKTKKIQSLADLD